VKTEGQCIFRIYSEH